MSKVELDFSKAKPILDFSKAMPIGGSETTKSFLDRLLLTSSGETAKAQEQPLLERFKKSFGNVENKEPIKSSIMDVIVPYAVVKNIWNEVTGKPDTTFGDMAQFSADIPARLTELPSDILKSIPGGTRASQGIGQMLGTYVPPQGQEDYLHNKEALIGDALSGASFLGPGVIRAAQFGASSLKNLLKKPVSKILGEFPERQYAKGANLPSLLAKTEKEMVNPSETSRGIKKVQGILDKNYPVRESKLIKAASADKALVGAEKSARLNEIPDIDFDEVVSKTENLLERVPAHKRESARNIIKNMLNELSGKGTKTTLSASAAEKEKQLLQETYDSEAEGNIIRNAFSDILRGAVRTADEPLAAKTGRSIADINAEYDPLRMLTQDTKISGEGLVNAANKRATEGLKGNRSGSISDSFMEKSVPAYKQAKENVGPYLQRKIGKSLYNLKKPSEMPASVNVGPVERAVMSFLQQILLNRGQQ